MSRSQTVALLIAVYLTSLASGARSAAASAPFVDNFDDGSITDANPVTWVRVAPPFDLGEIAVEGGDLVLTPRTSGPIPIPNVPNYWEMGIASQDQLYHDVDIRTQVRALKSGPSAVVMGALDTYYTDGKSGTGVYFGFVVDNGPAYAILNAEVNGVKIELASLFDLGFSHLTEDINMRLLVQGNDVFAWAWPSKKPDPKYWLLKGQLPASMANVKGRVELGAGGRTTSAPVAFRYVSVVPEPSGASGIAMGSLLFLVRRRRFNQ